MSTTPDTAKLAAIGMRFRAPYLVQQAGYTIGIASVEGEPLAALLPPDFLEKVALLRDEVDKALQDKTLRASEAKQATNSQNQQMHAASIWMRRVGKRCQNATQMGIALPLELTRTSSSASVPGMLTQMSKTLAMLGEHMAAMDSVGTPTLPLLDEGRKLFQALQQADSAQEQRAADLPASVLSFLAKKGALYAALKIVNNAGHELYAHDMAAAARFNLSILHRRGFQFIEPTLPQPTLPADKPAQSLP